MQARAEQLQGLQRAKAWRMMNYSSMYLVTGDKQWADKTRKAVVEEMKSGLSASKMIWRAPRYAMVAIAYDNCYDSWEKEFRLEVVQWLGYRISTLERGGGKGYNASPHSNWQAITKGSLGIIGMALLHDPGVFPAPPAPTSPELASPKPVALPEGEQASVLASRVPLTNWLVAASFEGVHDVDRLQAEGGRGKLTPKTSTPATHGDETVLFSPLSEKFVTPNRNGGVTIKCVQASDNRPNNTSYYFTWVKVEKEQHLRAQLNHWRTSVWIGGERLNKGEVVHLKPGYYPLMMQVSIGQPSGVLGVDFVAVAGADAERQHREKYANYLQKQKAWEDARNAWLADSGKVQTADMAIEMGRIGIEDYLTSSLGDRGYPMEGDGYLAFPVTVALGPYLHAAETAMGITYQDTTGIGDVLALQLWHTIGDIKINHGPPGWKRVDESGEERAGTWPTLLGVTKEAHLPALKTWFDQNMGMSSTGKQFGFSHSTQGILALMNYPWEVEAQPIMDVMAPIYYDRYHGHIVARREWTDRNDHVACVHILERPRGSVHLAGPYPHYLFYAEGEKVLSFLAPQTETMSHPGGFLGGRTIHFKDLGGGSFVHGVDLSSKYVHIPSMAERKKGAKVNPTPKSKVTRYNAVVFVDEKTTIYAILDQEKDGQFLRSNFATVTPARVESDTFAISVNSGLTIKGLAIPVEGEVAVHHSRATLGQTTPPPKLPASKKGKKPASKRKNLGGTGLSVASNGGHLIVMTTAGPAPKKVAGGVKVGERLFRVVAGKLVVE